MTVQKFTRIEHKREFHYVNHARYLRQSLVVLLYCPALQHQYLYATALKQPFGSQTTSTREHLPSVGKANQTSPKFQIGQFPAVNE